MAALPDMLSWHRRRLERVGEHEFVHAHEAFVLALACLDPNDPGLRDPAILHEFAPFFVACQQRYLFERESAAARAILAEDCSRRGAALSGFGERAYERVRDLCSKLDRSPGDRAVMVGCGALPSTLLWLNDHGPAIESIGIDREDACVATARRVARALGQEKVEFRRADGCEFDYSGFDFVYVANQVTPKARVLERIARTADRSVTVVVRNPTRNGRLLAHCVRGALPEGYGLVDEGEESLDFLSQDLLLRLREPSRWPAA